MKYILFVLITVLSFSTTFAKRTGSLSGKVIDYADKREIIGASVRLDGTSIGKITDRNGNFTFKSIPIGEFSVLVSYIGYETVKVPVSIKENELNAVQIELKAKPLIADEIVVTANKKAQSVQEVPISMSLISGRIFAEKSITTLDNALQYAQGVEVNNDNISIRGSSGFSFGVGSRAILLLDGNPMISGDNGDIKSDALPIPLIDKIEIVKGAGSALYGASALGGVINIITKEPTEQAFVSASTFYGIYTEPKYESWKFTEDYQSVYGATFGYAQKFGTTGFSLAGSFTDDESYRKYDNEKRYMLFSKFNIALGSFTQLNLTGLAAHNNRADWVYWQSLDSATRPPSTTDLSNRITSDKISASAELRHIFSDKHFIVIKSGIYMTNLENSLTGAEYRQSDAKTLNTDIQANSKIHDYFFLTSGLSHTYNVIDAKIYGNRTQNTFSLYAQMESPVDNIIFTYGGRFDYERTESIDARTEFSPKFGLSYKTVFGSNIRFSIGRGFRPASIAERFASVSFQGFDVLPNTELKSESSWSAEVGFNQPLAFFKFPMFLDFAFYNNELFDMIEPKIISGTQSIQFQNTTRARITGFDLNVKMLLFNRFGWELGTAVMLPKDLDSNTTLKYRSTLSFISRMLYTLGHVSLTADYRYKSRSETIDEDLRVQIKNHDARVAQHILDLGIKYKIGGSLPLYISLNAMNVLDYYYTEVPGNLGKTRHFVFQIGYGQ